MLYPLLSLGVYLFQEMRLYLQWLCLRGWRSWQPSGVSRSDSLQRDPPTPPASLQCFSPSFSSNVLPLQDSVHCAGFEMITHLFLFASSCWGENADTKDLKWKCNTCWENIEKWCVPVFGVFVKCSIFLGQNKRWVICFLEHFQVDFN